MAKYTHPMPDIGEGITEAEIVTWQKNVGDMVHEDEEVVDMMTDKATVPLESPVTGRLVAIAGEAGDMVAIGSPIFVIEVEGDVPEDVVEEAVEVPAPAPVPAPDWIPAWAGCGWRRRRATRRRGRGLGAKVSRAVQR